MPDNKKITLAQLRKFAQTLDERMDKVDEILVFDTEPVKDSTKLINSGGVYSAIEAAIGTAIGGSY